MDLVAIGAIVFSVLLVLVAAMVWQEIKNVPEGHPVYVIEEAVPFVMQRLGDDAHSRLDADAVLRILEWEVYYLQGLARANPSSPAPVAGSEAAIEFIVGRSAGSFEPQDVAEVLDGEVAYLAEIGAIGAAAGPVLE